jgi:hypothetical protein
VPLVDHPPRSRRSHLLLAAGVAVIAVVVLLAMGRQPMCTCGYVKLWHGVPVSSENSQHVADWYTPSHLIHGLLFYGVLRLVGRRLAVSARLILATALEAGWEILENTPLIINRYREATIALDYYGDSVLNSASDIAFMAAGFLLASRLPVWAAVALAVALELFVLAMIRDNLSLNILMLIWPLDGVRQWQAG